MEYFFKTRGIAENENVNEESVISYILDGINDPSENNILLYEAHSLTELKRRLENSYKIKEDISILAGNCFLSNLGWVWRSILLALWETTNPSGTLWRSNVRNSLRIATTDEPGRCSRACSGKGVYFTCSPPGQLMSKNKGTEKGGK